MDILYKYETAIRNKFSSMTTEEEERNKDKIINRNLMNKLGICNMCYLDEYTCAYKKYYYKGVYNTQESSRIRHLYFTAVITLFVTVVNDSWENIIKTYLEEYLKTQDIQYLKMLIEGAQIILHKKEKEDEFYKKAFI